MNPTYLPLGMIYGAGPYILLCASRRVHAYCEHRGTRLLLSHLGAAAAAVVAADGHLALDSRPRLHPWAEMQSVVL